MPTISIAMAAAILGLTVAVIAADEPNGRLGAGQPSAPVVPPASGATSSDLSRSGGVITPPANIDSEMKHNPPSSGSTMPIVPPPGTPGGNPAVKPK